MFSRLSALLVALSLVVVPTVMRSRQRVEQRDTTRLSIRLNWQSETPPQKDLAVPDRPAVDAPASIALVQPLLVPGVAARPAARDERLPQTPLESAPDVVRGPPSLVS